MIFLLKFNCILSITYYTSNGNSARKGAKKRGTIRQPSPDNKLCLLIDNLKVPLLGMIVLLNRDKKL